MTKVYEQFDAAFRHMSAFAILKDGKHVANVTLKHGGSVVAYVHWLGIEMARGTAGGGGYDRATAAVEAAACKINAASLPISARIEDEDAAYRFRNALSHDDGAGWTRHLERAGFTVCNVIA